MDIRFLITSLLLAVAWASEAAVPQLTDFNTNQFGTAGGIVTIKNGALVTNLVGAGGSSDWTNAPWGLQPVATNNLVDIHHGTNEIWVNQLATGGNGTTNNPWTGLEGKTLNTPYTHYYWPQGYYKITNTIDLLGQNTYHSGEAGTVIKFYGSGVAVRFKNATGWTQGVGFENFRIDCQDAIRPIQSPFSIQTTGTIPVLATVVCTNHGYVTGDFVDISGANEVDYNGVRPITVLDADRFTYIMKTGTSSPTNATGTLSLRKSSVCLQFVGVRNNYCKNLVFANASLGLNLQACVTGDWDNIRMTKFEEPGGQFGVWTVTPITGLLTCARVGTGADGTTTQTFRNLIVEYVSDWGIICYETQTSTFNGGTSEGNGGGALVMLGAGASTLNITFLNVDNEVNNTKSVDWWIYANSCNVVECFGGTTNIIAGGKGHFIGGGYYGAIRVESAATRSKVHGSQTGQFLDAGTETSVNSVWSMGGTQPTSYEHSWYLFPKTLPNSFGGTVNVDAGTASSFSVLCNSDFTLSNPLHPSNGQRIFLRLRHDAIATNYVVTLDTSWSVPPWMNRPALNVPNGVQYLEAQYDSTRTNWDILRWIDVTGNLNLGATNTVQHGNAAGNPAYSSVSEYDLGLTDITTANFSTNLHGFTPKGETNDQKYLQATGIWAVPTGTGVGANASEPYVTIGSVGSLSDERALTSGQVSITDNGPGSTVTIGATTDTPRFTRLGLGTAVDGFASLVTTSSIKGADGSAAAPTFTFGSETNMGFYRSAGLLNLSMGGARRFLWASTIMGLEHGTFLTWYSPGFAASDTFLTRDVAATLQMGQDSATPIAQKFKGPDGTGSNINGGNLTLGGGSGTGTGAGGDLITQTTVSSNASGSSLQIYSTRHYESAKPSPMTNSTANPVFNILIGSTHYFGCKIFATTFAADAGGDFQALSEELIISAVNKSGTISNTVSASWGSTLAASVASTLTTTWTAVTSGASLDIKCTPVSSLTPTTYYTKWKVDVLSNDPATIAPYR